ncbi:MAG: hypothetical protein AAF960_30315 [Bacteroidota bacterium]
MVEICDQNCGGSQTVTGLTAGEYTIKSQSFNPYCFAEFKVVVTGGGGGGTDCKAAAGTLNPVNNAPEISDGTAMLRATIGQQPTVPSGFQILYVLTSTDNLVIQGTNTEPRFMVNAPGRFRIHTLVFNPATLDLSIVVPGVTTGFDVNSLLIQGGGKYLRFLGRQRCYLRCS